MNMPKGGPPNINNRNTPPASPAARYHTLKLRGQAFKYRSLPVSLALFTSLGFNPRRYKEGATIMIMEQAGFERFAEAHGLKKADGIYPQSKNGDQDAVLKGEIAFLPDRSRNIVLPQDHEAITLAHELLHDIFIGGGIELRDRTEFFKSVQHWYQLSLDPKMPHHHKNRAFYEEVAEICAEKYNIEKITPLYNLRSYHTEVGFRIFAGECFAYAGEALLHPEEARFKQVPEEIVRFFRQVIRLFDRSVYQRANGQA